MGIKVANNAFGTLASSITNSATSITLSTGQGSRFPTLGAGDYFYATLIDTSNNLEIVKCTARSTDVLTVTRAQENTTARAYSAGDRIEIRITAATFEDATGIPDGSITPEKLDQEYVPLAGGTMTGTLDVPDLEIDGRLQFNLTNLADETSINWNNVTKNSVSYALGSSHTNAPLQGVNSIVVDLNTEGMGGTHDSGADTRGVQLWFTDTPGSQNGGANGRAALRPKQGSTWHPWEKILTTYSFRRNFARQSGTMLTSTSTYQDISGCSISVTPISVNSRFLIFARFGGYWNPTGDAKGCIVRDGTIILENQRIAGNTTTQHETCTEVWVDHPNTTSVVTYKLQGAIIASGAGSFDFGHGDNKCSLLIMEFEG